RDGGAGLGLHPGEGGSDLLAAAPPVDGPEQPPAAVEPDVAPDAKRPRGRERVVAPLEGLGAEEITAFDALQKRIGVRFRRLELLREAMTHASWHNERREPRGP